MLVSNWVRGGIQRLMSARGVVDAVTRQARPCSDRGVLLDIDCFRLLALRELIPSSQVHELPPRDARRLMDSWIVSTDVASRALHRIEERFFDGPESEIGVRVYTPRASVQPLPAIVYFHGGGFVIGSLESHDGFCRYLAQRAGAVVIAVDYRLAPEHRYPAAVHDCEAAFRWVIEAASTLHIDPERVAIAGDSAGGNLAAVTSRRLRDASGPMPLFQMLIYPGTDLNRDSASHLAFADGFLLTRPMLDWFMAQYLEDSGHAMQADASPLLAENLAGLPPAHVVTAGFDPLRDEGEAYVQRLRDAGVVVSGRTYESLIHGFVGLGGVVPAARFAIQDIGDELHDVFWH